MRLFDADKLQVKHYLQRSEHPIGYEGTQAVYDYKDVLAYDIESAETVEAIPIEWIKKWISERNDFPTMPYNQHIWGMLDDWEKENEHKESD